MSTTITNITELQAMEDDLDEDYVLGNDIDASATSGWNSGAGFDPIGSGATNYSYSRAWDDDFGYAGQSGSWTIYPSDGVYFNKVNEESSDSDATFIQATANNSYVLLSHDALALDIHIDASSIVVRIKAVVRNTASGTSYIQGMLNIAGTEYLVGSNTAVSSQTYATKTWTMTEYPPRGYGGWTVSDVASLSTAGVGVKVSDATPNIRITQMWIQVEYKTIFTGTFDGAGFTISDLFINRDTTDYIGLFGYTDGATITDCVLTNVDITGDDEIGGCIGYAKSCTISGGSVTGSVTCGAYSGGFIGYGYDNTITNCHSSATITSDADYVGGFMGESYGDDITICYATGNVTSVNQASIAGFIGEMWGSDIVSCYSTGDVTAGDATYAWGAYGVGGFVGYTRSGITDGTISKCYATGDVVCIEGTTYETTGNGGFVGQLNDSAVSNCYARGAVTSHEAGGFAGTNSGSIDKCYATGLVTGDAECGGLVANTGWTAATNSYWDTQTTGQATSDSGTGKTTAQMKTLSTFYGWDIGESGINRNDGYPFLIWETGGATPIWQIYSGAARSFTIPDLFDDHGRHPKGARVRAYRVDTHELVTTAYLDQNGSVTVTGLPNDVDVAFHVTWGGPRMPARYTTTRKKR